MAFAGHQRLRRDLGMEVWLRCGFAIWNFLQVSRRWCSNPLASLFADNPPDPLLLGTKDLSLATVCLARPTLA